MMVETRITMKKKRLLTPISSNKKVNRRVKRHTISRRRINRKIKQLVRHLHLLRRRVLKICDNKEDTIS